MANGWGVYYATGSGSGTPGDLVFDVDSVVDLKQSGKAKVSDFPVEQGSFASYNKAVDPEVTQISLAVNGMPRSGAFLAQLKIEKAAANLYDVVTPEQTYLSVTLESFDYSRAAGAGANLIVAILNLKEIRQVTPGFVTVSQPHAKNPNSVGKTVGGKVQTTTPAVGPLSQLDYSCQTTQERLNA